MLGNCHFTPRLGRSRRRAVRVYLLGRKSNEREKHFGGWRVVGGDGCLLDDSGRSDRRHWRRRSGVSLSLLSPSPLSLRIWGLRRTARVLRTGSRILCTSAGLRGACARLCTTGPRAAAVHYEFACRYAVARSSDDPADLCTGKRAGKHSATAASPRHGIELVAARDLCSMRALTHGSQADH